jgi:hypothetical protein
MMVKKVIINKLDVWYIIEVFKIQIYILNVEMFNFVEVHIWFIYRIIIQ